MTIKKDKLFEYKTPLFIIVTIISTLLLFLFGCWIGTKASGHDPKVTYGGISENSATSKGDVHFSEKTSTEPMKIWKEKNGVKADDFKILTVTDLHFSETANDFCLKVLDQYIQTEHPDLVVLCGDTISRSTATELPYEMIDFFEERNQYWTFVLGNHDGEGWERNRSSSEYWPSREKAFNVLSGVERSQDHKPAVHCLARSYTDSDPSHFGYGTNQIDVIGKEGILQSMFFFDCMTIDHKNEYVCEWLENQLTNAGNEIIGFTHKPFIEMQDCWDTIGKNPDSKYLWGIKDESICYDGTSSGVFDVLENHLDKNPTMVFGHDHVNNLALSYKGVKFIYSLGLQYNSYNSRFSPKNWIFDIGYVLDNSICPFIDGASEFIIRKGQTLTVNNEYNQLSGVFDNLKTELWKATKGNLTYNVKGLSVTLWIILPLTAISCAMYYIELTKYQLSKKNGDKAKS